MIIQLLVEEENEIEEEESLSLAWLNLSYAIANPSRQRPTICRPEPQPCHNPLKLDNKADASTLFFFFFFIHPSNILFSISDLFFFPPYFAL